MVKRALAWVLSVVMLFSVCLNVSFDAEATGAQTQHNHSDAHACSEQCAGGAAWTAWENNSFPTSSGHYYLTKDITLSDRIAVTASKNITVCLNGYDITVTGGSTSPYIAGKLTVADCTAYYDGETYVSGAISGSTFTDGGLFNVRRGGMLVLEGGCLTGNRATSSGGAISLQASNSSSTGGIFHMYGGEITGNVGLSTDGKTQRSGAIVANNGATIYLHGGKIYGNSHNSNGAIYMVGASSALIVDGAPVLESVLFKNDPNTGLQVNGLTEGASITCTNVIDAATADQVISIAQGGSQSAWSSEWVTINGQVVSMDKGNFVFGIVKPPVVHDHCQDGLTNCGHTQESWIEWTATDSLPTTAGNYFLAEDVTVSKSQVFTAEVKLCLNGHSITRSGSRIINVDAGGDLTLTDCQGTGTIQGGGISLNRGTAEKAGGMLNMYGGIVDGNTAITGVIYMQTAQASKPGPVFNMYGGQIKNSTVTSTGGIVLVQGESKGDSPTTFNLYGGKLTGNAATSKGGTVYVNGKAVANLLGGEISGNTSVTGGAAVYATNGVVNMKGTVISGNTSEASGGAIFATEGSTLTIESGTISENTTKGQGGGIYTNANTVLTVTGGTIEKNTATKDGGGLYIGGGTAAISGVTISGNQSVSGGGFGATGNAKVTFSGTVTGNTAGNGGGLMIQGGADLTVQGGSFTGNTTIGGGGAIYVNQNSKLTLSGGSLTENNAKTGGAIYVAKNATAVLNGGTITQNAASAQGGGVYPHADADLTLSGTVQIKNNAVSNLYLPDGALISVGGMQTGATVGVTANPGAFSKPCQDMSQYFTGDSSYRGVGYVEGALHMVADGSHKHCLCTGVTNGCDHTNIAWMAWEGTDSLPTTGTYYLLNDVVLTAEVSISKDLTLCLNGHTVTAAKDVRILSTVANSGATVTLTDCGSTGKLTGGVDIAKNTGGGAIFIRAGGTLDLYGGTISGNKSVTAGGAILLAKDTKFHMYGGTITDNGALDGEAAISGGAIFAMPQAKVTIAGGSITGNTGKYGGAVYLNGGAELRVTGGKITGNTAARGGGIYTNDGTILTITGGEISGNTATTEGGGVYGYGSIATVSGGVISGNTAGTSGGGLRFGSASQVTLSGGTVSGNYAKTYGGGIYANGGTLDIADKVLITKNEAGTAGGGVCFNNNIVGKITGGTISNNFAPNAGGVIIQSATDLEVKANVEMSGGLVTGNTANGSGGGIYAVSSVFKLSGGTVSANAVNKSQGGGILVYKSDTTVTGGKITGNSAPKDGGGLYISGGTAKIENVTITGNTSKASGGGFGATNKAVVTMTGGLVTGNKAPNACGVIIQGGSTLNMYGGTVSNNTAEKSGGGMYINNKSTLNLYGGTFTGNQANHGGAMYVNKSTVNLQGGLMKGNKTVKYAAGVYLNTSTVTMGKDLVIEDNAAQSYSGGMYAVNCELTINGTTFRNNYSKSSGGAFYVYNTRLTVTDMLVTGNVCDNACGGIGISQESVIDIQGGVVENNVGTQGGGIMIQHRSVGTIRNLVVRGNEATQRGGGIMCFGRSDGLTFENCEVYENHSATNGGGVFLISTNGHTPWNNVTFNDMKIYSNTSDDAGAGLAVFQQVKFTGNNCSVENNSTKTEGGGVYTRAGSDVTIHNMKLTGNQSVKTGSALYVGDNIHINGLVATGNKAQEGAAVYFPQNMYDGESFTLGYYIIGGDILVADNEGGDMFIDEGTAITTTAEGLGKNTEFHVQLSSGILTNTILGVYDYEGGNLDYTVTYGDRSVVEPEYEAPVARESQAEEDQQEEAKNADTWLYVGIGAFVAVILAVVAVILGKKKKDKTQA